MNRVVVTGIGVTTSNANNKEEFIKALLEEKEGIKNVNLFDMSKMRNKTGGQSSLKKTKLQESNDYERLEYLALKVLNELCQDSKITKEYLSNLDDRCGLSISTSLPGNERLMRYIYENDEENPYWLVKIPYLSNFLCKKLGIKGCVYTTEPACAAGTAGIGIAYDLIKENKVDLMIVGGVDPLTEFAYTGFHALKALSPSLCRPFDEKHDGMILGEGSAFFVLESLENAKKRHAKIYAEILSYSICNEAYHITSPNPTGEGAEKSMLKAIEYAGINKSDIDYINTHGTGTKANDNMELKAIKNLFKGEVKKIAVSSTKSMTGHCLGAAGSIELAACILAIDNDFIPGTVNLKNIQDGYDDMNIVKETIKNKTINIALSNSFAFAGNTASVVVKRFCE